MDRAKMKLLVSILMDSPLYLTMNHEERLSLLFALTKDYPNLLNAPSIAQDVKGTASSNSYVTTIGQSF